MSEEQKKEVSDWATGLPHADYLAVQAIMTTRYNRFRTKAFSLMEGSQAHITWEEAALNPHTQLWQVETITRLASDCVEGRTSRALSQSKVTLRSGSLYDAIYECAAFEAFSDAKGMIPSDQTLPVLTAPDFRVVAVETGFPFDEAQMPLPAARGLLLVEDSLYGDEARTIAARTAKAPQRVADPKADVKNFMKDLMGPIIIPDSVHDIFMTDKQSLASLKDGAQRLKLRDAFIAAAGSTTVVFDSITRQVAASESHIAKLQKSELSPRFYKNLALLMSACTGFTLSGYLWYKANFGEDSRRWMESNTDKIKKLASTLPPGEMRTYLTDFATKAMGSYYMALVAHAFHIAALDPEAKPDYKSDMKLLKRAAQAMELSGADTAMLEKVYGQNEFPTPAYFTEALESEIKEIRKGVEQLKLSI